MLPSLRLMAARLGCRIKLRSSNWLLWGGGRVATIGHVVDAIDFLLGVW